MVVGGRQPADGLEAMEPVAPPSAAASDAMVEKKPTTPIALDQIGRSLLVLETLKSLLTYNNKQQELICRLL